MGLKTEDDCIQIIDIYFLLFNDPIGELSSLYMICWHKSVNQVERKVAVETN